MGGATLGVVLRRGIQRVVVVCMLRLAIPLLLLLLLVVVDMLPVDPLVLGSRRVELHLHRNMSHPSKAAAAALCQHSIASGACNCQHSIGCMACMQCPIHLRQLQLHCMQWCLTLCDCSRDLIIS